MTDAEIALQAVKANIRNTVSQISKELTLLYARVGQAKSPQDVAAIADGRETIISKIGSDVSLVQTETALKTLSEWAK